MLKFLLFVSILHAPLAVYSFIPPGATRLMSRTSHTTWTACEHKNHPVVVTRRAALGFGVLFANTQAGFAFGPFDASSAQTGWGTPQKAGVQWDGGFANVLSAQPLEFSTEVVNGKGNPVLISFVRPKDWKISTNTGIAIQNYITADSAYVLVCPAPSSNAAELDAMYLLGKVFDIKGRYGAFGKIDDIKVIKTKTETQGNTVYRYVDFKYSSLSPGGREIERVGCLKATVIDGDAILLVASAKAARWKTVLDVAAATLASFSAVPAPQTALKRGGGRAEGSGVRDGVEAYKLLQYNSPIWTS